MASSWNSNQRSTPSGNSRLFGNEFSFSDLPTFNLNRPFFENSTSFIPGFFGPSSIFRQPGRAFQPNNRSTPQPSTSRPNNGTVDRCDACNNKFNVFRRRRICNSCGMDYCTSCFNKDSNVDPGSLKQKCLKCRVFNCRPFNRILLMTLPVRDLRWYLRSKRIPANFCKEKNELVDLIISCVSNSTQRPSNSRPSNASPSPPTRESSSDDLQHSNSRSTPSDESSSVNLGSDWEIVNENGQLGSRANASTSSSNQSSRQSSETNTPAAGSGTSSEDAAILEDFVEDLDLNDDRETSINSRTRRDDLRTASSRRFPDNLSDSLSRSFDSRPQFLNENLDNTLSKSTESLSNFRPFNIEDMQTEDDIRNLSVRQLKLVLMRNYVNYHGCCEKEDLLEKTIRLWKQVREDKEIGEDVLDENLCKICMASPINCVLLECGHYVSCIECGKRLSECPICRQYVVRALRIFKS